MGARRAQQLQDKTMGPGPSINCPRGTGAAACLRENTHFNLWEVPRQLLGLPNASFQGPQGLFFHYRLVRTNC
jgi:hypothetical protein